MAGIPITIEVTEGDTRPVLEFQVTDSNDVPIDISAGTKTVTLYYRIAGESTTKWKKALTKSDAVNGKVQFTPAVSEPFYPAGSAGTVQCEGELRYEDSAASPAIDVRIRAVLFATVKPKFAEP